MVETHYDNRYLVGPPGADGVEGPPGSEGPAGPSGATIIDFDADLGTVDDVTGLTVEVEVAVVEGDGLTLNCLSGLLMGIAIVNVRVTGEGTIEVQFLNTTGAPVALGLLSYRLMVFQ